MYKACICASLVVVKIIEDLLDLLDLNANSPLKTDFQFSTALLNIHLAQRIQYLYSHSTIIL